MFAGCVAGVLLLVGTDLVRRSSVSEHLEQVRADTVRDLAAVRGTAEGAIYSRVHLTQGLKSLVSIHPDLSEQEFADYAANMMEEGRGIRSVTLIRDNIINDVYPRRGNEGALGLNLMSHPVQRVAAERARQTGRPWLSGPIQLVQGGEAFVNRSPVYMTEPGGLPGGGRYWGLVSVLIDKDTLLDEIRAQVPADLSVAVRGRSDLGEPGEIISGDPDIAELAPLETEISLPTGDWTVYAVPRNGWPTSSPAAFAIGSLGCLLSGIGGALVFLIVRSGRNYREAAERLKTAHGQLQHNAAAMRKAQQRAEAANEAKSQFPANMSYEIRTPLSAVTGITELVLDTPLSDVQREYMTMVRDSGDALLVVINDILDFSKIEADRLELESTLFNLRKLLAGTLKPLGLRAGSRRVEVILHINSDVPDTLVGDPHRLRQILVNLVGNAVKFTEFGEIRVSVQRNPDTNSREISDSVHLLFAVEDTGIGIAPEKLTRVFNAFEQADSGMSRQYGGTGLGLAICSRLVRMMDGEIFVESQPGLGSTFSFSARFSVDSDSEGSNPPHEDLRGCPVLIVDDSPAAAAGLAEALREIDLVPQIAESAFEAIESLRSSAKAGEPIRVLVIETELPEGGGRALVEQIMSGGFAEVPRFLFTSLQDQASGAHRTTGETDIVRLQKPVSHSELHSAVRAALRGDSESASAADRQANIVAPIRPLRILLAEDDAFNRHLALVLLRKWGHRVDTAETGAAAVIAWRKGVYDLILMDVQMPEMDGLEATRVIRQAERSKGSHVPIVAITAHALSGDRERCLEAGMDGYASKTLKLEALHAEIARFFPEPATPTVLQPRHQHTPEETTLDETPTTAEPNWQLALEHCDGDRDLLLQLVEVLLKDLEETPLRSSAASLELSREELAAKAHQLKGSIRLFGPTQALDSVTALEEAACKSSTAPDEQLTTTRTDIDALRAGIAKAVDRGLPV